MRLLMRNRDPVKDVTWNLLRKQFMPESWSVFSQKSPN